MPKRKFYDWRYNTKSAIAERKQKVIEQTVLERRKRQAIKAAESEAERIPQAISSSSTGALESDSLLERYETKSRQQRATPTTREKRSGAGHEKLAREDATPSDTAVTTPSADESPLTTEASQTPETTPSSSFQEELAAIRKLKIPKHEKGVKINLLKQKYKEKEAAARDAAKNQIDKSNKHRLAQTKRMQKKKKSGQLKIGSTSRVLLQRIHKSISS